MRITDFTDYFTLKRFLVRPWSFLRSRKGSLENGYMDVEFKGGFAVRVRDVTMDRHIFHRIFARDEYRLGGVAPATWDTVIDIGAHIGLFAVRAHPLAKRVLSFEPVPANYEILDRNVKDFDNVTIFPRAVAGKAGTVTIHLSENPSAHSMYMGSQDTGSSVAVECLTLADIFREHAVERCDLLKLDCEGAEYEILEAVPDDLWPKIHRIVMEYHAHPGDWTGERLAEHLQARGYDCDLIRSKNKPDKGHLYCRRS